MIFLFCVDQQNCSADSVGVIVKVEIDSFRVLDNNGRVQTVRLQVPFTDQHHFIRYMIFFLCFDLVSKVCHRLID